MATDNVFENAKVYKIVNQNDPDEFYVGSTKNELRKRWGDHKSYMMRKDKPTDSVLYCRMKELSTECFRIVLLEPWPCKSRDELRQREDHWIQQLKPRLNMHRAFVGREERLELNRTLNKEYREANPGASERSHTTPRIRRRSTRGRVRKYSVNTATLGLAEHVWPVTGG